MTTSKWVIDSCILIRVDQDGHRWLHVTGGGTRSCLLVLVLPGIQIKWLFNCKNFEKHMHVCSVTQLCPTLCNPMDCNPPGSSIHGGVFKSVLLSWRSGRQKSRGRSGRPLAPTLQISMGQFMQKSVHCHTSWFFTFESFLSCCRIPLFLFNVYLAALDLSCSSQDLRSSLRHVEFLVAACKLLVAACRI